MLKFLGFQIDIICKVRLLVVRSGVRRVLQSSFGWSLVLAGELPIRICVGWGGSWGFRGTVEVYIWLSPKLRDAGCHWGGFFGGERVGPGIDVA